MISKNLSFREIEALFYLIIRTDKETADQYLEPKLKLHEGQIRQILKPDMDEQEHKELNFMLYFICGEPMVRSQMKISSTISTDKRQELKSLLVLHRDVEKILVKAANETFEYSVPVIQIVLKEKENYEQLLKELTQLIKQKSSGKFEVQDLPNESPLQETISQVEEGILQQKLDEVDKVKVVVREEEREKVFQALLPYISQKQGQVLSELLKEGSASKCIYFKGNNRQLGDFFRRLKENGNLLGISYFTELAEWLSQYFFFKNKDEGDFTQVKMKSILKVMQDGDRPKTSIKF